jgi:hypothetical protein
VPDRPRTLVDDQRYVATVEEAPVLAVLDDWRERRARRCRLDDINAFMPRPPRSA